MSLPCSYRIRILIDDNCLKIVVNSKIDFVADSHKIAEVVVVAVIMLQSATTEHPSAATMVDQSAATREASAATRVSWATRTYFPPSPSPHSSHSNTAADSY